MSGKWGFKNRPMNEQEKKEMRESQKRIQKASEDLRKKLRVTPEQMREEFDI